MSPNDPTLRTAPISAPVVSKYPKILSNPTTSKVKDAKFSVAQLDGTFTRPDETVYNDADEKMARADGFTVTVPDPHGEAVAAPFKPAGASLPASPDTSSGKSANPYPPNPAATDFPNPGGGSSAPGAPIQGAVPAPPPAITVEGSVVIVKPTYRIKAMVGARMVARAQFVQHEPDPADLPRVLTVRTTAQSLPLRWHDEVIDCLERLQLPTDGSYVMLIPGTNEAFAMDAMPYDKLCADATVFVVPNNSFEVGKLASPTKPMAMPIAAPVYPATGKTLKNPASGQTHIVTSADDETKARSLGFTEDITLNTEGPAYVPTNAPGATSPGSSVPPAAYPISS